jgi:hypothetical protein
VPVVAKNSFARHSRRWTGYTGRRPAYRVGRAIRG